MAKSEVELMEELNFEAAMEKLEQIVAQLEGGDAPLEQAIDLFQEGMRLSKLCSEKLQQVERKIEMLTEQNGELKRQPFSPEEEGGSIE
ncbi:exodeoxyribonuclease VII small subunit [Paenibacillus apiarius]|uniref:Exodeoxyribonuclease 7 small subunit n=1 Tax=Paenibacillus apiarius TaxID=46240 RepID=A0ABT4DRS8_9BACL|nr:exodeoxyribonuclease VII small subunit [Paenibacillus apiarius]MCY9517311.1 exodeoxyribonuclease VII small subunit [Paenibacillus apiarius]MCY9518818.1 exodeoxyribonuclease VII small subunit [Paenibacillus apiarius]MCY9552741.1 exodeoxyribonuclease VII small subunit [Paenibacillus apiarius]MCY9556766.1 exodeoxyribonuclease VII small subunit [Paenibacillus apiarius]MCY9684335.1 exodeoxyribonuclease VII small subunit [Paenibacillus apiarius]